MKARAKLFTVSSADPENHPMETRLIRAQTAHQVEKLLEAEALSALSARVTVSNCTMEEAHELGAAGVKVEEIAG